MRIIELPLQVGDDVSVLKIEVLRFERVVRQIVDLLRARTIGVFEAAQWPHDSERLLSRKVMHRILFVIVIER